MRCGTTWLYEVLSRHPSIGMSSPKQTEFFNRHVVTKDLGWYLERFQPEPGDSSRPVRGEITPFYCRLPEICVRSIAELLPNVKLLLSMRNPIDRTWSQVVYDFAVYKKSPLDQVTPGQIIRHIDRRRTDLYNDYARMIRIWSKAFGEEALHIGLYDELRSEPVVFIRRILSHLGLPEDWDPPSDLIKTKVFSRAQLAGSTEGVPDYVRWHLANRYYEQTVELNRLLEGRVESWVRVMEEWRVRGRLDWRARSSLNRGIMELPERLAYAVYSVWNGRRIAHRIDRLNAQWRERSD